jgi:hypothetical protein
MIKGLTCADDAFGLGNVSVVFSAPRANRIEKAKSVRAAPR